MPESGWQSEPVGSAHHEYLHSFRRENYLFGGRGTHKSGYLVEKNATCALVVHPYDGAISYLTEQTAGKVRDVLVPIFRRFVDPSLYVFRSVGQELDVLWATGHVTRLRSRQAKSRNADPPFRGPSACWIGHDEIARDPAPLSEDLDPIAISRAMLRGYDPPLCLDLTTTPVKNWLYNHIERARCIVSDDTDRIAHGSAAAWHVQTDQIDPAFYEYLKSTYSETFAQQELVARWRPLAGRVWVYYSEAEGPAGNVHWHTYDPALPTVWGVDLGGGRSAWNVAQLVPSVDRSGQWVPGYGDRVLVTVGEATPDHVGAGPVIDELMARFGKPARCYIGADYRTPGNSGHTAERDFVTRGIQAQTITGDLAAKDLQQAHAAAMLRDARGMRRWCVSSGLVRVRSEDGQPRGIRTVMDADVWPDVRSIDLLDKDKRRGGVGIEDARDAWLYLLVGVSPPRWHK